LSHLFTSQEVIAVSYIIITSSSEIINKTAYINCESTSILNNESDYFYFERDLTDPYKLNKSPFTLICINTNGKRKEADHYIPINAEYKTGLNDMYLKDRDKEDLTKVLSNIDSHINSETKVIINCTESINCLKSVFENSNSKIRNKKISQKILALKL